MLVKAQNELSKKRKLCGKQSKMEGRQKNMVKCQELKLEMQLGLVKCLEWKMQKENDVVKYQEWILEKRKCEKESKIRLRNR